MIHVWLHGLPEPETEVRFAPPRRWRWDLAWVREKVAVEIQGATFAAGKHVRGAGYQNDCEKLNEGQLRGWLVLWVTPRMIKTGVARAAVERALAGCWKTWGCRNEKQDGLQKT